MTHATPDPAGPDTVAHESHPAAGSLRPMHHAWRVLWAAPALVMVALRITAPDAWAALALLIASIAVMNADGLARCAGRLSKGSPDRRLNAGERTAID
ncbi:MAG: hypothetical protein JF586_09515 [Burkholderiales bacterium]|nr:hypothetical protein [Burkholderiales bacterium]